MQPQVRNYDELYSLLSQRNIILERVLEQILGIMKDEASDLSITQHQEVLVTWWNEEGTKHDIANQMLGFVLLQELKKVYMVPTVNEEW